MIAAAAEQRHDLVHHWPGEYHTILCVTVVQQLASFLQAAQQLH
jgi:hypothetical protein